MVVQRPHFSYKQKLYNRYTLKKKSKPDSIVNKSEENRTKEGKGKKKKPTKTNPKLLTK